jgi:hypothetical protein
MPTTTARRNTAKLSRGFIKLFFECVGWDIDVRRGAAEKYKDVIHEDAIKIGGVTKAPDYCFRFGGTRKFSREGQEDFGASGREALRVCHAFSPRQRQRVMVKLQQDRDITLWSNQ